MELWRLRYKLRHPFSRQEKAAMAGKIPMTKVLFWKCLDTCWKRWDMDKFWDLGYRYPAYVEEMKEREQTRPLREEEKVYWEALKERLDEYKNRNEN